MRIAGVIIAGGAASRLGGEKPFMTFRNGTLLDAVIARIRPQTDVLALNLRAEAVELAHRRYDLPILLDGAGAGCGPLAGIVTALNWARALGDIAWLASVPADTPFLPPDLVAQLAATAQPGVPVYADDGKQPQYLCALWPIEALEPLRAGLAGGALSSLKRAHAELCSLTCPVSALPHAFFNVNTSADLAEAERLAAY